MFNHMNHRQRGDTIVEVLLATVVISIVIAGAYTLTNRATRANQEAIERTTATNLVREQVEFIRGLHTYGRSGTAWQEIENDYASSGTPNYDNCAPTSGIGAFSIDNTKDYDDPDTIIDFAQDPAELINVWAEAYSPTGDYIDIHVRACWLGLGNQGMQRSVSIIRLVP